MIRRIDGGETMNDPELLTREGLLPTVEATRDEVVTDLNEQAAHLSAALDWYDIATAQEGFLRMSSFAGWRQALATSYGGASGASKVIQGRQAAHRLSLETAKAEFMKAYGLGVILAADPEKVDETTADAEAQYRLFEQGYRGASSARREKRAHMRRYYLQRYVGNKVVGNYPNATPEQAEEIKAREQRQRLNGKVNLVTALTPEFAGLSRADFEGINFTIANQVKPARLRAAIENPGSKAENVVQFTPDKVNSRQPKPERVIITPPEWKLLLRSSAEYHANIAVNRSRNTQRMLVGKPGFDEDAPRRAGIHMIEEIDTTMRAYSAQVLNQQRLLIHRFQEAAQYNGNLNRFGSEAVMRVQMTYLWESVISDMMWALAVSNKWNHGDEVMAVRCVKQAVYGAPTPQARLHNFNTLLDIADKGIERKQLYISAKLAETSHYISSHETPEERQAREQKSVSQPR